MYNCGKIKTYLWTVTAVQKTKKKGIFPMKISFSTLACPDFEWSDIYSMAKDFQFDGIEIRGLGNDIFSVKAKPFSDAQLPKTVEKLKTLGLEIPCLSSGACLKFADKQEETTAEITAYAKLANCLGTPYIRILADLEPQPADEVDDDAIAEFLKKLVPVAEEYNVTLLVETNGVYCDTKRLKKLLDKVGSRKIAALWDMHHPYRFKGELPSETVANLGEYIKYTHTKDSVNNNGKIEYKLMGEGDMPIKEMLEALKNVGYTGYVSLEWVKRWSNNLCDAGIVIPHYASFMAPYKSRHKHSLQDNNRKTGKYIWPKERIIDYTFPDVLDRVCEEFPNQYAFRYTELDYTRTYSEFRDDVDTFARALLAMGVKKGDHVAIWATNVPAWYITFWATTKIGAVLVTVNTAYKIHEAEYLLKQSDTHTLVMIEGLKDSHYNEILREICPELDTCEKGSLNSARLPVLRNVVTVGFEMPGCYTWDEAVAKADEVSLNEVEKIRPLSQDHP